jgi:hypothetical protein
MSCDVAKFTITKGLDNTFVFTIKADGSTLPMTMTAGDTFTATLVDLETGATPISEKPLTKDADLASGKVTLVVTSAEAAGLTSERGSKTDRYYLRPTYKLIIDCSTANNGDFIAKVPEIYVD